MKDIKKFVDIELLRDKDVLLNGLITRGRNDLAFKKGSLISITTKIDGSNFSIIYDPDENNLACFSRRLPLTGIDGLNGAVAYARKLDITPFKNHPNYRVFGEWLCLSGDTIIDTISKGQIHRNGFEFLTLRDLYKKTHENRASWHYGEKLVLLKLMEGETKFSNILNLYNTTRTSTEISKPMARREIFKLKYKKLITINEKLDEIAITKKGIKRYNKYINDKFPSIFSLFQDEWKVQKNKIKDIIYTGEKIVYEVTTKRGFKIKSTLDHKFLTPKGFIPLKDLKVFDCVGICLLDAKVDSKRFSQNRKFNVNYGYKRQQKEYREKHPACEICGETKRLLHLHHKDGNHTNNDPSNWQILCNSCHSKITQKMTGEYNNKFDPEFDYIISIKKIGKEDCYDICMEGSENCANFLANNFIVHNCKPKHNKIKYNDDMENRWIIYSIWDEDKQEWLLQDKVKDFCKEANLEYVEVLYEGPFISWEHCREFMKASKKYGPIQEGIVVRLQDENRFDAQIYPKYPVILKIVSEEFAEVMKHTRKPKDPEEEKRKQGAKGKAAELLSTVITENRVAKIISKLQEDEKLPRPLEDKDIGAVMKLVPSEVYKDIIKEEPETFEAAGEYASKVLGQITAVHVRKLILG